MTAKDVEKMFWYTLILPEANEWHSQEHFSIVHRDFSPKPAFEALKTFTAMRPAGSVRLKGAWHDADEVDYFPQWTMPGGTRAGMVWTIGFARTAEFEFDSDDVEFLDLFGKPLDAKRGPKGWLLPLSDSPIYFRGCHIKPRFADVRGFGFIPPWGSNGRDVWLEKFNAAEYRRLIRLGKKAFPNLNTLRIVFSMDAWYDNRELAVQNMRTAGEIVKSEGMKMIPVYFNNWHTIPDFGGISHEIIKADKGRWRKFGSYAMEVARALEPLDVVLVHDICNEPLNNCLYWEEGTERMRDFVAKMAEYLHSVSRVPVTVGSQAGLSRVNVPASGHAVVRW